MGIGKELAGWLRSRSGLTALIDVDAKGAPRIHPARLPQSAGQSPRAIVYHLVSDVSETSLNGVVMMSHAIVQFDCYGGTPSESDILREGLKKQLDAMMRGQVGNVFVSGIVHEGDRDDIDEPIDGSDVARFIGQCDYRFSYQRPTV